VITSQAVLIAIGIDWGGRGLSARGLDPWASTPWVRQNTDPGTRVKPAQEMRNCFPRTALPRPEAGMASRQARRWARRRKSMKIAARRPSFAFQSSNATSRSGRSSVTTS
jgi:hypothetical protein